MRNQTFFPPWQMETRNWLLDRGEGWGDREKSQLGGALHTPHPFLTIGRKRKQTESNPLHCNLWRVVLNTLKPISKKINKVLWHVCKLQGALRKKQALHLI